MQNTKRVILLAWLLLGNTILVVAQFGLPEGSQQTMLGLTTRIADIDSSLTVDQFSLAQRRELFKRLFQADQQYRDSLVNGAKSELKQQLFSNRMAANDQANQVLLRKIVSRFGWPTRKEYGDQATFAAWLIVWHSNLTYQNRYYPLIKRAYQQGLIKQNPVELQKRLTRYCK